MHANAFGLALALVFALSSGLSLELVRTAPVSVVFLCPDSGTLSLSGAGVADGYETPARVGKTVAGSLVPERTPAPVFGATSQKTSPMSAKKKGTACPKGSAAPLRSVHVSLPLWVHQQTVCDAHHRGIDVSRHVAEIVAGCLSEGDLLLELPFERAVGDEVKDPQLTSDFTLRLQLPEKRWREFGRLARAHGFDLPRSGLALALSWRARHGLTPYLYAPGGDQGEAWKGGAS